MKTIMFSFIAAGGLGVAAANLALFLLSLISNRAESFYADSPKRKIPNRNRGVIESLDKKSLLIMGGGTSLASAVFAGSPIWPAAALVGAAGGFLLTKVFDRFAKSGWEFELTKEVALLYESVDLFIRAGFTVRQAIQMSIVLVPELKVYLSNCLDRWPAGPLRALEQLGEDIGVKQADLLISLLMQAEEGGKDKVSGIMEQEAVRLEELRQSLAEGRISKKPIYSTVYLFLPVASVLGMIITPLAYRAIQMIAGLKAGM